MKFLVQKLARYSFESVDQVQDAGQKIGQHLGELLQQKNKQNIDAGTIYQVSAQKNLWSLAGLSNDVSKSAETSPNSTTTEVEQPTEEITNDVETQTEEVTEATIPKASPQNISDSPETIEAPQDVPDSPNTTETTIEAPPQ